MKKRPYLVNIPVRVMVWNRPEILRKQFDVIKKARPSVLFLVSDGGRTYEEMNLILQSRSIFDAIDWECTVYKFFFETNQGMYTMMQQTHKQIWTIVDRCIFLEDDYIPAVSFFQFCAELLQKYENDERIEMICGHNPFGTYCDAEPNDYFFTEIGWSIWGIACWRRTAENQIYPLEYKDNAYIKRCLKDTMTPARSKKALGYCKGKLVDGHVPGPEYYHAANSALFHRLSIVPTRNMICNIGYEGAHTHYKNQKKIPKIFGLPTHEITFPIKHPIYVIDDRKYGRMYSNIVGNDDENRIRHFIRKSKRVFELVLQGQLLESIKRIWIRRKNIER